MQRASFNFGLAVLVSTCLGGGSGGSATAQERRLSAESADPVRFERRGFAMGTELSWTVEAPTRAAAVAASEAALRAIETVERRLSTWRDDSLLMRQLGPAVAVGVRHPLDAALAADLAAARVWWKRTDGAFDPAIGALVDAWDLRGVGRQPEPDRLRAALAMSGLQHVEWDHESVLKRAAVRFDAGGFGKGIGLDAARDAALGAGATRGSIDLGGQFVWWGGRSSAAAWAIADPRERDTCVLELNLPDAGSIATSGNSERGLLVDGVRLGHLLDPRTGRPAADFGSLSVVTARSATAADCLSTGLYVLGPDAALRFAARDHDVEVCVLDTRTRPGRVRLSDGLIDRLQGLRSGWTSSEDSTVPSLAERK